MYQITFPPQSNRSSWVFTVLLTDLDDQPIDLTGCAIRFNIRGEDGQSRLAASTEDGGVTILDTGIFRWFFPLDAMQSLSPIQHATGLTIDNPDASQTIQLFVGPLNIVDGVVASR